MSFSNWCKSREPIAATLVTEEQGDRAVPFLLFEDQAPPITPTIPGEAMRRITVRFNVRTPSGKLKPADVTVTARNQKEAIQLAKEYARSHSLEQSQKAIAYPASHQVPNEEGGSTPARFMGHAMTASSWPVLRGTLAQFGIFGPDPKKKGEEEFRSNAASIERGMNTVDLHSFNTIMMAYLEMVKRKAVRRGVTKMDLEAIIKRLLAAPSLVQMWKPQGDKETFIAKFISKYLGRLSWDDLQRLEVRAGHNYDMVVQNAQAASIYKRLSSMSAIAARDYVNKPVLTPSTDPMPARPKALPAGADSRNLPNVKSRRGVQPTTSR